jgi:hypothetical protein
MSFVTPGTIVEFALNSDGEVDSITSATAVTVLSGKANASGTLIGTTPVDAGVVVFLYDATDDEYSIGAVTDFDTDTTITAAITHSAIVNTDGKIVAIVIDDSIVDSGASNYGVINTTKSALDADDNAKLYLEGFNGSDALSAITDQNTSSAWTVTASTGALQVLTINSDGVITGVSAVATTGSAGDVYDMVSSGAVTVGAVDGQYIKLYGTTTTYMIADDAVLYVWNDTDGEWEVETAVSSLKGKTVKLYQSDSDVEGFDYVLAK